MENIDDIKILQVTGLGGIAGNSAQGEGYADQGQISLSDQVVNSALRYRTQAPLIDSLIEALGGEMVLGAAAADQALPNPSRTVLNSTVATAAAGMDDEDPPF